MSVRNRTRLQVEELERRETPSSLGSAASLAARALADSSMTAPNPMGVPNATGTFTAVVMVSDLPGPVVVPVTISQQTGAHFSTTITANGLTIDLKGELNPKTRSISNAPSGPTGKRWEWRRAKAPLPPGA